MEFLSAGHAEDVEVRLSDRLFSVENPAAAARENRDFRPLLNPDSLRVLKSCKLEPGVAGAAPGTRFQFERLGYFCADTDDTRCHPVFNRTVTLKDTWARIENAASASAGPAATSGKKPDARAAAGEISIEDFAKLALRAALVVEASLVDGGVKPLRLKVDLGEGKHRQVFAGIRAAYPEPAALVGKTVVVVANLKARKRKGWVVGADIRPRAESRRQGFVERSKPMTAYSSMRQPRRKDRRIIHITF